VVAAAAHPLLLRHLACQPQQQQLMMQQGAFPTPLHQPTFSKQLTLCLQAAWTIARRHLRSSMHLLPQTAGKHRTAAAQIQIGAKLQQQQRPQDLQHYCCWRCCQLLVRLLWMLL
jgi:hypothetical protein